jgi:hypothetical protein
MTGAVLCQQLATVRLTRGAVSMRMKCFVAAVAAACLLAPSALAVPLYTIDPSSGVGSSSGAFPFEPLTAPGTVSFQSGGIDVQASLTLLPQPIISVSGTSGSLASISAVVAFTYYFEIVGPEGLVPVNVTASGTVGGSNTFSGHSLLSIGTADVGNPVVFTGLDGVPGSWALDQTFNLVANQDYFINMTAIGQTDTGSFFVTVDPLLTIDPAFAELYRLELSPGVGNSVAVPGPIVGAGLPGLILASGGLLGWWRRRTRQTAV